MADFGNSDRGKLVEEVSETLGVNIRPSFMVEFLLVGLGSLPVCAG